MGALIEALAKLIPRLNYQTLTSSSAFKVNTAHV